MKFFSDMMAYLTAHPFFLVLLIVGVVALLATIVVMIIVKIKRAYKDKKEEQSNMEAAQKNEEEAAQKNEEEIRAEAERRAAAKKAVFDRLDAEREAAEREEAAAAKTTKKSPTKKKQPAAEEMAVAEAKKEEPKTEKKATKKPAVKKTAPVEAQKEEPAPVEEKTEKKVAKKPAAKKTAPVEEKKEEPAPVEEKTEEPKTEKKPAKKTAAKKVAPVEEKKEEPAPVEEKAETPVEEDDTVIAEKYAGKWIIYHVLTDANNPEDEMYFFELRASNGEKLLSSEEYTSYNGARKGIETYKSNIEKNNFKIATTKKGDYIFKIMSGKNTLLCNGENYSTKVRCESAIKSTKRFARTAILDENVRDLVIPVPAETETVTEVIPLAEGTQGKWLISSRDVEGEKVYFFELFANNGEKLLSSEEYTTYAGAANGIQTHKQNIAKGNFRISLTKNGDYIYKLLNGNNQLLCLGEHYKTKARCESAVESVKRFAGSPTLTDSAQAEEQ